MFYDCVVSPAVQPKSSLFWAHEHLLCIYFTGFG